MVDGRIFFCCMASHPSLILRFGLSLSLFFAINMQRPLAMWVLTKPSLSLPVLSCFVRWLFVLLLFDVGISVFLAFVSHVLGCLIFSEIGTALSYLLNSSRVPRRNHKQKKTAPRRMPLFTLFNLLTAEPLSQQWRQPKCINGTGCRRLRR